MYQVVGLKVLFSLLEKGKKILIVGGDSFIGKELLDKLSTNYSLIYTLKDREQSIENKVIHIDLLDLDLTKIPSDIPLAYICAGISKKDDCENNPDVSQQVNVTSTIKLIEYLVKLGTHVVFLSSNEVFSGNKPFVKYNDEYTALSLYGKQKIEVEKAICKLPNVSIVRLTKVLSSRVLLLNEWINCLASGEEIQAFTDFRVSPISLSYTVKALKNIGLNKISGIFHLSGKSDESYFNLALLIAKKISAPSRLVNEIVCENTIGVKNKRNYSSLDMSIEISRFKLLPQDVSQVIDEVV